MTDRISNGFAIYQRGHVEVVEIDNKNSSYHFRVKGSNHKVYNVHYEDGSWMCECEDWLKRSPGDPGAHTCKHINSCYFELAEIKGVNQQATLSLVGVKS